MNERSFPSFGALPPADALRLDRYCNQLEAAWVAWLSQPQPRLEAYLGESSEPYRSVLLRELLQLELAYRRRIGETPALAEYRARLPEHDAVVCQVFNETPSGEPPGPASEVGPECPSSVVGRPDSVPTVPALAIPGYEYLGELGRGGMGVVYKVRQVKADRVVALKRLREGAEADGLDLARFRTEAEALARTQHANIVQIFEVGECRGQPFFSLEYCPGGSLADRLASRPIMPREAALLVAGLARGVQHAHDKGIIHRDLKPGNVLFAADGTPKLTDFGLAKKLDARPQTVSGAIVGTPAYMAPEQAAGRSKEVGPATDVYALGAILYECLSGCPPFTAPDPVETLLRVLSDEPLPPRQLQPKVPRDLQTVCLKCLRKDPQKRYTRAMDLADDLQRFLKGEPIRARPVRWWERAGRWAIREPWLALGVAVILPFLGAFLVMQPLAVSLLALWLGLTILFARGNRRIVLSAVIALGALSAWFPFGRHSLKVEWSDRVPLFLVASWLSMMYVAISRGVAWYFGMPTGAALRWSFAGTFAGFSFGAMCSFPLAVFRRDSENAGGSSPWQMWVYFSSWAAWILIGTVSGAVIGGKRWLKRHQESLHHRTEVQSNLGSSALNLSQRQRLRAASLIGLVALGGLLIAPGFVWRLGGVPAPLFGFLSLGTALFGLFGANIWYGGPLDPRRDSPAADNDKVRP
jgi:tRNA A-37 threonylcarbamoyl transferase component Bud32